MPRRRNAGIPEKRTKAGAPARETIPFPSLEPVMTTCPESCAVAGVDLTSPEVPSPAVLISPERIRAAGSLAVLYQYGMRIRMFAAVEAAVRRFDSAELRFDDAELSNILYCWPESFYRVKPPEIARLAARVLGLRDPALPAGVAPDPLVQGMLSRLVDALSAVCQPPCGCDEPSTSARQELRSAAETVQIRLSSTVSGMTMMRIRDLRRQFDVATDALTRISALCDGEDLWQAVADLAGDRLPDGTDLVRAAAVAEAWQRIFRWLEGDSYEVDGALCTAASILRA